MKPFCKLGLKTVRLVAINILGKKWGKIKFSGGKEHFWRGSCLRYYAY